MSLEWYAIVILLSCLFAMVFVAALLVMAAVIFGGRGEDMDGQHNMGQMSKRDLGQGQSTNDRSQETKGEKWKHT